MKYQIIGSVLFVPKLFRGIFSMSTLKKILSVTLSFLMLVSIAYTYIETVDPEPAYASGEFSCLNSGGKAYIFQSTFSGSTLTISRRDTNSSSITTVETFSGWSHGSISEVNSLSMDPDGNMYAVLKQNDSDGYLYKLNYNSSGAGTVSYLGYVGNSDYNSSTYYERTVSGSTYKYLIIARGFMAGDVKAIRLNSAGTAISQNIDVTVTGGYEHRKAKDMAWISDDAGPGGLDLIGYNYSSLRLLGGTISHGGSTGSSETMTISTSLRGSSVTGPSGESGAAMYFGNGLTYFLENGSGRLYKYDANYDTSSSLNSGEWAATSYYMSTSSNTDGAACGIGSPTEASGSVSVTTSLNSCSSGSATSSIAVTASGATMYVDVQYSTNGGSSWSTLQDGNSISSGATETYTIPSAVSHGTTISWQYRSGTSNPSSGSYTAATSRTVSCPTLSFTTSTSAGSCS